MFDLASSKTGAFVSCATSNDEDHPASNIIDGNDSTFWMTTGLYPQVVVITFPQQVEIKSIHIKCTGIKYCVLESSSKNHPTDFEPIAEQCKN
jgi:heat shock protein beta-11